MGSYADAKAAFRARLVAGSPLPHIAFQNIDLPQPWPPRVTADGKKVPASWVYLEIGSMSARNHATGAPGNIITVMPGFILAHVFVPRGAGDGLATQHAEAIGNIYRNQLVYDAGDGCYARCWAPRVDEGGDALAEDVAGVNTGNWFRVTASIPFEYWHRG